MAKKDTFHQHVIEALQKDNWTITHDPLVVKVAGIESQIDLGAERIIAAQKGKEKIAVEIKTFGELSFITTFYGAIGQFITYRTTMRVEHPDRLLFLAVPIVAYKTKFNERVIQDIIKEQNIKLIIYDPHKKIITQWIK